MPRAKSASSVGKDRAGRFHELGRVQIAERVRREVADAAEAPVDVLQAAAASSGTSRPRNDLNRSFHAPGRSATARSPDEQRQFQLEPQGDVQVVRRLVRLDADERRPHVVDREVERVERHVGERRWERLLQAREEVLPERPAAADLVLPQPRLRFVDAERAVAAAAACRSARRAGPARTCRARLRAARRRTPR